MKLLQRSLPLASLCLLGATSAAAEPNLFVGRMPAPTPSPEAARVERAILKARALTADQTTTCGFANGDASDPLTCDPGATCAQDNLYEVGGCCQTSMALSDCKIPTACYDYTHWLTLSSTLDDYEFACTDKAAPSCMGYESQEFTWLACGTTRTIETMLDMGFVLSGPSSAFTTPPPVAATASEAFDTAFSTGAIVLQSVGSQATGASTKAPATQTQGPTQTPTAAPATAPSGGKSLSTGAIVGIAVAAAVVGVAALVAIGCCYYFRRKRSHVSVVGPAAPGMSQGDGQSSAQANNHAGSGIYSPSMHMSQHSASAQGYGYNPSARGSMPVPPQPYNYPPHMSMVSQSTRDGSEGVNTMSMASGVTGRVSGMAAPAKSAGGGVTEVPDEADDLQIHEAHAMSIDRPTITPPRSANGPAPPNSPPGPR